MKSLQHFGLMLALAAMFPISLSAQEPDYASKSDADLIKLLYGDKTEMWQQPCTRYVPLAAEMRSRQPRRNDMIWFDLVARARCAEIRSEFKESSRLINEMARRFPGDLTAVQMGLYYDGRLKDADAILNRLRSLDAETLSKIESENFWSAVRVIFWQNKSAELEALALEWHERGALERFEDGSREGLAEFALREAVRVNKLNLVPQLLASIRSPSSYINMLGDRRYSGAWPQIENFAGPNLERANRSNVDHALTRLEANRSDADRLKEAAHALLFAGRFENAIAVTEQWRSPSGAGDDIVEGTSWALNVQAYAYDALGQIEKADAVFDELAKLPADTHPWVVNFVINRAARLVGQGRWSEGLEAAGLAREVADKYGSKYAKLLIARDRTCALVKLGRSAEIENELAFLRENISEGAHISAQGLMCAGKRDEAKSLLIKALDDETQRSFLIREFQPDEFELFYTPTVLPQANELLSESEELARTFNEYGRLIPMEFVPAANKNRVAAVVPPKALVVN